MKLNFEKYREELFKSIHDDEYYEKFMVLIESLSSVGKKKEEIYALFLSFHKEIQISPDTKENEEVYDKLSDFMDGFTSWEKTNKILPNEPDI